MRIAVAYDCFFPLTTGGGERQYGLFAEAFARAGHEVDYLTRRQWEGTPPVGDGFTVVPVSRPVELYDGGGVRKPLGAVVFALGLFRHLVRNRRTYDAVVVSALPVLNVFAARAALLGTRTRMCADFLEVWRREQWLEYSGPVMGRVASFLQRRAARISPLVSAHSQMNGRRLAAEGAQEAPIVSPGLIDPELAANPAPARTEVGDGAPTLLYVGRHIADKRVEAIPAALAHARTDLPELRAVILGEGPQRAAVEREVARLGLQDVVDLPGFVSQEELDVYLRDAAVLVNPSRREGYGLVVVEACAAGTPVVLADAPDNASVELVEDGVNGYVAPSTSPEDLGDAVLRAVAGGSALRRSARAWFEQASRERTAEAAALGILRRLEG